MEVWFSTVARRAPLDSGGELVQVDLGSRHVLNRRTIAPTDPPVHDANPRGGARGGRGVVVDGDCIVVCSFHSVLVSDRNGNGTRVVSGPTLAGLHECWRPGPGRLWVTATDIDAALELDLTSGQVVSERWPRDLQSVQQTFDIPPQRIDRTADHRTVSPESPAGRDPGHLHLNAVTGWRGRLLGLSNRFGAVIDLDDGEIVLRHARLRRAHNLVVDGELLLTSGTVTGTVEVWDLGRRRWERSIDLARMPWVARLVRLPRLEFRTRLLLARAHVGGRPTAHPLFVRGLALARDQLLVGFSPATIVVLDWPTGRFVDGYTHSTDVSVAVHGLAVAS